ncbi:MAG: hypothetical protein ACE5EH_11785 [Gammaproteobacteria bacterium]
MIGNATTDNMPTVVLIDPEINGKSPTTGIAGSLNEAPQWGALLYLPSLIISVVV